MKTRTRKSKRIPHPALTSTTTPAGIAAHDPDVIPPLSIDPEIRDLIAPLSKQERQELEKSLRAEGCLDRLKGWAQTGILLDGHNRKDICDAVDIPYNVEWLTFSGRAEAIDFVLGIQLARRNVSDDQRTYLIGKRLENEKQAHGGARNSSSQVDNLKNGKGPKGKTAERIAKEANVSPASVNRAGARTKAIDLLASKGAPKGALVDGRLKITNADAAVISKLPPAKVNQLAKRLAAGKDAGSVAAAIRNVAPTPKGKQQNGAPGFSIQMRKADPTGLPQEFTATLLTRLDEAEIIGSAPVKRLIQEIKKFVKAWA